MAVCLYNVNGPTNILLCHQQYEVTYGIINSSSTELYWKDGLEPNVVYKLDDNFVRA